MIWSRTSSSRPVEHALVEAGPAQRLRPLEQHRARVGAGDGDAQIGQHLALAPQGHGHARHRILDRAADADLVVGRAQAGYVLRPHGGDQLSWPQAQVILAVAFGRAVVAGMADVEILQRQRASARGPDQIDLGAERQQGGGQVAAEGGEAHAAALGRHVADVAGGLEAVVVGLPPPLALIVEDAARVEAQVAADGAHVAMGRPGDGARRLRHDGKVLQHAGVMCQLGQRHRRAEREALLTQPRWCAARPRRSRRSAPAGRRCRAAR